MIKIVRSYIIFLVIIITGISTGAYAENFPTKPIRIIVPFGAGGLADLSARIIAQKLTELLAQSVVVENYPGAGGVVAAGLVAKSAPDGHTMLLMSNANAISSTLFKKLPHDNLKDFTPISTLGYFDLVIIDECHRSIYGDLTGELFKEQAKINIQVIPFNGTPAVISAVRGGQVDVGVEILGPIITQINSNAIRVLAVTGSERSPFLPDAPTAKELNIKEFTVSAWNALAVPSKTPAAIVAILNKAVVTALNSPDVQARFKDLCMEPRSSSVADLQKLMMSEIAKWGAIINKANIQKQ